MPAGAAANAKVTTMSNRNDEESKRATELIERLQLQHLNVESGLYSVVRVSDVEVEASDGISPASNAIYLMLSRTYPRNYVQWLYSDDYHVLIEGGPADYYLFHDDGRAEHIVMGRDLSAGQQMMVASPGGTAKAIVLHDDAEFLLVGSVLSPAWSPQRAKIGGAEDFVNKYLGAAPWATPETLRELIGPNYGATVGATGETLNIILDESGQIIWQEMQLTEKQLRIEMQHFASTHPDQPLRVKVMPGSPEALLQRIKTIAAQNHVALATHP